MGHGSWVMGHGSWVMGRGENLNLTKIMDHLDLDEVFHSLKFAKILSKLQFGIDWIP